MWVIISFVTEAAVCRSASIARLFDPAPVGIDKYGLQREAEMLVVPILAEGVNHTILSDLPDDIRNLARLSSPTLTRDKFEEEVLQVLDSIEAHFKSSKAKRIASRAVS